MTHQTFNRRQWLAAGAALAAGGLSACAGVTGGPSLGRVVVVGGGFGGGMFSIGGQMVLYGLAPVFYPTLIRGTGVGVDAYSLIEQGKVDVLLQASPKDRQWTPRLSP